MKITKSLFLLVAVGSAIGFSAGCHKTEADADGIRAAVTRHLTALNTLNLQAMDMEFTNTSIQGNQANATVIFRPKTGAPAGASMQISYRLEKRDGAWTVVQTAGMGGAIEHPAPGTNPHIPSGQENVHGNFPDVRGLVAPAGTGSNRPLPPGHPPVNPSPPPKKQ